MANVRETFLTFPLYLISHPFKGFDEMKFSGKGSMLYALVAFAALGLVSLISGAFTGFVVIGFWSPTPSFSAHIVLLYTYSPIALFCIANWSVTTITNGKGSLREIFLVYSYAIYPQIFLNVLGVLLSNVVTLGEVGFANGMFAAGVFFVNMYMFIGLIVIHEYTLLKAILTAVLTVLSMAVITFVFALFFSLFNNVTSFFFTIIDELGQLLF